MLYLDSSAIVKLILTEPESEALKLYLDDYDEHTSSGLARVEVFRAIRRTGDDPRTAEHAERILSRMGLLALSDSVLADAATQDPQELRSLDAIHLATALSLDGLDTFVTYDRRLADAAREAGLSVASPA